MLFLVGRKILVQSIKNEKLYFTVLDTSPVTASIRVDKGSGFIQDECECGGSKENNFCKHVAAGILLLNKYRYFENSATGMNEVLPADITANLKESTDLKLVNPSVLAKRTVSKENPSQDRQKISMRKYIHDMDVTTPESENIRNKRQQTEASFGRKTPLTVKSSSARVESKKKPKSEKIPDTDIRIIDRLQALIPEPEKEVKTSNKRLIFVIEKVLSGITIILEKGELQTDGKMQSKGKAQSRDAVYITRPAYETVMLLDYFFVKGSRFDVGQKIFEYETFSSARQHQPEFYLLPGMIEKVLAWEYLYWREKSGGELLNVEVIHEPYSASIDIQNHKKEIHLRLKIENEKESFEPDELHILLLEPLTCFVRGRIITIPGLRYNQLYFFKNAGNKVSLSAGSRDFIEGRLIPGLAGYLNVTGIPMKRITEVKELSKGILLGENDIALVIKLVFLYDGVMVHYDPYKEREVLRENGGITIVSRNKDFEAEAYQQIIQYPVKEIETGIFLPRHDSVLFLYERLEQIKLDGFSIYGEKDLKKLIVRSDVPTMSLTINSHTDWFDVKGKISFGDHTISLEELLASVKDGKQYVQLEDGSIGVLPERWVRKFLKTLPMGRKKDDRLIYSGAQTLLVDELMGEADSVTEDPGFRERVELLRNFTGIESKEIPEGIAATVREYQKEGYSWFYFLKNFRFGGILADDMGLGKTLQVLMLLKNEKEQGMPAPVLIVCPTSLVFNWINEAEKFTPSLKFLRYTGSDRADFTIESTAGYDVVITTYGILLNDAEDLRAVNFHYIILDESQKIKNPLSKTAKAAYSLNGSHRLCMTGTPIENNLTELWSQFHFVNPGMYSTLNNFKYSYITPIQKFNDEDALQTLKRTSYPFILRRTKELVASELPAKSEILHYCEMEPEQRAFYEFWKDSIKKGVMAEIEKKGLKNSKIKVLEGLLRLRQICNHPLLLGQHDVKKSGKFDEFRMLIDPIIKENHKILVFSQFTKMLEIMRRSLEKKDIRYSLLTGSTTDREGEVRRFQNDESTKIFLISLKAGGFGLNLTAADYVIHYDPWWNPAAEAQATDRAHRIGQDKRVFVYKMITRETVEEKIIQLQDKKRNLANNVLSLEKGGLKSLTMDDIAELFG